MAAAGRVTLAGAGGPGFDVVTRARDAIEGHGMLAGGESIVVAVSGGPDSTCLLDVLSRLSGALRLRLVIGHVDHGLSEASAEVAARVEAEATAAGLEIHVERAHDLAGPNLQARARDFRYGFLEGLAGKIGAARIATGHTLDDRVETLLARLVHGGATDALASIPPVDGLRIRPLIEVRRAETVAYCGERGLGYHADPANTDMRFDRARVRGVLVQAIESGWGEGAVRAVAAAAARMREDSDALTAVADDLHRGLTSTSPGGVSIDRAGFEALPRALRRRVLDRAIGFVRDRSKGIEAALDALEAEPSPGSRFAVAGGIEIVVERDVVAVLGVDAF